MKYVPALEAHSIRSRHVSQTFHVQVMRPLQTKGEMTRFPVVYATDGNFAFDVLKGISYSMQLSERDAPRFILVGIGYPGESPLAGSLLRARDLTFPTYPKLSTKPPNIEGVRVAEEGTRDFYGGEDFQRFLGLELIPHIDEHYATIPNDRTYFGHSAGGGFGLFTMFTATHLFRNYIISSPGLCHHDNADFLLQQARTYIAAGRTLEGVRLYMSVGTDEEFEPTLAQWQLTSSFYRMAALLKSAATLHLDLTTEALVGETHSTAWPMAFIHGLQTVFGVRAWRKEGRATAT
jgi:uncharacterized protein